MLSGKASEIQEAASLGLVGCTEVLSVEVGVIVGGEHGWRGEERGLRAEPQERVGSRRHSALPTLSQGRTGTRQDSFQSG